MNTYHDSKNKPWNRILLILEKMLKHISAFWCALKASRKTLLLIVVVAVVSIVSTSLLSNMLRTTDNVYLPSLGTIKTIDVETYWDEHCENRRTTLDWGDIETGKSSNLTLYIKSVSNFVVTLNLTVTDWEPQNLSDYLTITWDYNDTLLNPSDVIQVTLTLTASSSEDFINYLVTNEVRAFSVVVHFIASEKIDVHTSQ